MKHAFAFAGVCGVMVLLPLAFAQEAEEVDPDALDPELEVAFREFSKEAADSRREAVAAAVEKLTDELAVEVKLDVTSKAKLADFHPGIIEATQAIWQDRFQGWLRPIVKRSPDPAATLEGWNAKDMARNPNEVWARPDRTQEWKDALKAVLNPAQQARYEKNDRERIEKARQDLQEYLQGAEDYAVQVLTPAMEIEVSQFKQLAALDEAREKKLHKAAESAIAQIAKDWRAHVEARLLDMADDQREERIRDRRMLGFDPSESTYQPKEHKIWQESLAEVLTEAERELAARRREEIRGRRAEALATVLVEAVDPFLGLTGDQRERLRALFTAPMLGLPDYYFVSPRPNSYYSLSPDLLFEKCSAVGEDEFREILDEGQMARWLQFSKRDFARNYRISAKESLKGWELPSEEAMDEFTARRVISRYLHRCAELFTKRKTMVMEAEAEAIARVVALSPDQVAILKTAAKGAAQELSSSHIQNLESWTRQNLQNVKPVDLPKRLQRLSGPSLYDRAPGEDPALWTAALERVLTSAQREAWKVQHGAAQAWKKNGQVAVVLTELEKMFLLSSEQRATVRDLLETLVRDYSEDLDQMLSPRWHCEGYYCLIPVALIPEEELEAALGKEQAVILRGRDPGHFADVIESIRKQHEQRVKAKR